jgi:GrpB-like predicted nucleotidyltransferase (UPF0157 family)
MIVIADPDPHWPLDYLSERARIRALCGPAIREIEHIGSTAVPGLAAKPVIDIMAAVDSLDRFAALTKAMSPLGYVPRDTGDATRLLLGRPRGEGGFPIHLHVVDLGQWPLRHERWMRDHLIANPAVATEYAALKRVLAALHGDDREAYTAAKTGFVQKVMDQICDQRGIARRSVWQD